MAHFRALGSTSADDAIDHTATNHTTDDTGLPIYWLGGAKVADDYADFYDGDWDSNAPTDESGAEIATPADVLVFTGTDEDGTKFARNDRYLGTAGNTIRVGSPGVAGDELSSGNRATDASLAFYGLSGVFTVIAPITTAPVLQAAGVDGATLTLTYDQDLDTGSEPAPGDFSVTSAGAAVAVSGVSVSGKAVTLTLGSSVALDAMVTVSYTPGTNPIRNSAEADAAGLTDQSVTNNTLPVLSIADAQGSEGEAIDFTVTLSPTSTESVTVDYQTSGDTAVEGMDYTLASGMLTFTAGDTTKTITVQTTEDTLDRRAETFKVNLTNPTNAKLDGAVTTLTATGTILDDDGPMPVEVEPTWGLVPSGLAVGSSFRLLFVSTTTRDATATSISEYDTLVQTAAGSSGAHTDIQFYMDQFKAVGSTSAEDAIDHTDTTHEPGALGRPIYWLDGAKVADDYADFYDGNWDSNAPTDESGTATASPDTVRVFTGTDADGTKFARNDRYLGTTGNTVRIGNPGVPGHELSSAVEDKGTSLAFFGLSGVFTVIAQIAAAPELQAATVDGVTLKLTYDHGLDTGSRPVPADFTVTAGLDAVTVAAVSISGPEVTLILAAAVESGQTVTISYTPGANPIRNGAETDAAALANQSVTNNTLPVLSISYGVGTEGDSIELTVTLSPGSDQVVTVTYSTEDGTAVGGDDFTPASSILQFFATETSKTITVRTTQDALDEGSESFSVVLAHALNAVLPNGRDMLPAAVTILDDDDPVAVEVDSDWGLVPSGLTVGDSFRLLFVSSTGRNGNTGAIGPYDTHVRSATAIGHTDIQTHSEHFRALASTYAVSARDHTLTTADDPDPGVPIYWLGGAKVADDYADFYDGNWDSNVPTDESGTTIANPETVRVFTGSEDDGTKFVRGDPQNARYLGTTGNLVRVGKPVEAGEELSSTAEEKGTSLSFYGLSRVFTVRPDLSLDPIALEVNGVTLTLTYGGTLDSGSQPDTRDFKVSVAGFQRTVSRVEVNGSVVTLVLVTATTSGQEVVVTYTPGTNPIRTQAGIDVAALAGEPVTNNTPVLPPPTSDREVLIALYNATNGPNWTNRRNWLSQLPLDAWDGVQTDGNGRVTSLNLEDNQLAGVIPTEVALLTNLESLVTADNEACAPGDEAFSAWLLRIGFDGAYCPPSESEIDIAIFYTPAARRNRGGHSAMRSYIESLVTSVNEIYVENGVGIRLSIVLVEETDYEEGDDRLDTHRRRLQAPDDGYMDEVHEKRNAVGADMVHLVLVGPDQVARGNAAQLKRVSVMSADTAFSTTTNNSGPTLFAHELGHAMGLAHDRYQVCRTVSACGTGAYPYSYGYINQLTFQRDAPNSSRWRTIMAYNDQCQANDFSCNRISKFSNPAATHRGDPLGIPGDQVVAGIDGPADAVRSLNNARETIARYRDSQGQRVVYASSWDLIPEGLKVGDSFRLLFVSSLTRSANSADISVYDRHVRSAAASGHEDIRPHSTYFNVVGSTADVDARDHTGTTFTASDPGVPIYWLNGDKVADDYRDFYDGTWDSNALRLETGGRVRTNIAVFTGSNSDGTKYPQRYLGTEEATGVRTGLPGTSDGELDSGGNQAKGTKGLFYALSGVFTVGRNPDVANSVTLAATPALVREDAATTDVTVRVTLAEPEPTETVLEVQLRSGTATSPEDFEATPGTLTVTIPAGETSGAESFSLTPVYEQDGEAECGETVILNGRPVDGRSSAFKVAPATVTLVDPDVDDRLCMTPVDRPVVVLAPDGPPNLPRLPGVDAPDPTAPAVPPTEAKVAIWTGETGYTRGQPVRLYRSLHPMGDENEYVFFYYLENLGNGRRFYFAPGIGSSELENQVVDQFGMSEGAFRAVRIERAQPGLIWAGAARNAGNWQFVAEVRSSDSLYRVKTVHAKFTVSNSPSRVIGSAARGKEINESEAWSSATIYELRGPVRVRSGAMLKIQAGTLIQGLGPRAKIIVERGGRIEATGTRQAPVVMTCDAPIGQRYPGCWGGLVVRGSAPTTNSGDTEVRGGYGGDNPVDSSGTLHFVRVEFAGGTADGGDPGAALALHGVGASTEIDYVQAHESLGDGFEIRGGTVHCGHCVSSGAHDDGLEWSQGWLGSAQHVFLRQGPRGDSGIEASGPLADSESSQRPALYNATLVGGAALHQRASSGNGVHLNRDAAVTMRNLLLTGFGGLALGAGGEAAALFVDGRSSLQDAIIFGNGGRFGVAQVEENLSPYVEFVDADPQLRNTRYEANPDPRPRVGSVALKRGVEAAQQSDGELVPDSRFLGAFETTNWLEEWTFFGPESHYFVPESDGQRD